MGYLKAARQRKIAGTVEVHAPDTVWMESCLLLVPAFKIVQTPKSSLCWAYRSLGSQANLIFYAPMWTNYELIRSSLDSNYANISSAHTLERIS